MWSVKLSPKKNVVCDCPLNSLHVRGIVQRISRSCRYYGIIYWFWQYTKNKPQKFPQELFMRLTCANGSTKKIYNTLIQRLRLIFKQRVIFKQMREALVNNEITIVVSTVHLLVIILFLDCSSYFIKFIDFFFNFIDLALPFSFAKTSSYFSACRWWVSISNKRNNN